MDFFIFFFFLCTKCVKRNTVENGGQPSLWVMRTARFGSRGGADTRVGRRGWIGFAKPRPYSLGFFKNQRKWWVRSLSRFIWALANLSGFGPSTRCTQALLWSTDTLGSHEKGGLGCFFLLFPPPLIFSVSLPFYLLQNTMIMLL